MNVLRSLLGMWAGRAIAGVGVVAIVGGLLIAPFGSGTSVAEIRTAPVARGSITQSVAIAGAVDASAQVRLGFATGGRLAEVLVGIGQSVAADQPLARVDAADLEIALRQAEASLMSARARYDETVAGSTSEDIALAQNSLEASRRSYEQAQRSAQNDVAAAEQSLAKAKTSFFAAKTAFTWHAYTIEVDAARYAEGVTAVRTQLAALREKLAQHYAQGGDIAVASGALHSAELALATAEGYVASTLTPALRDYAAAAVTLLSAVDGFDTAVAAGRDTGLASAAFSAAFQNAQQVYQLAASRLSAALDAPGTQVASAQTSVGSAYAALNPRNAQPDDTLEDERADAAALQTALTGEQQRAGAIKTRVSQAASSLSGLADAVSGGYASALQSYATAQDRASSSVSAQEGALRSAELSYQKTTAPPTATALATALATLQTQEIAVERARRDLEGATLRAPVAGVVVSIAGQVGEFVSSGGTAGFMVIANTSALVLHGTVGEFEVATLEVGQVATVTVDAIGSEARMTGRVTRIDPVAAIEQGVPVYGVDIQIDLPDPAVRAGMSGTATVVLASRQDVLTVPNAAIRTLNGVKSIQILREGTAVAANVAFGITNDTVTEVMSGLEEGDLVVLPNRTTSTATTPQQQLGGAGGAQLGGGGAPGLIRRP